MDVNEIHRGLNANVPKAVLDYSCVNNECGFIVKADLILPACRFLCDALHFNFLTDLCGMDYTPHVPRFGIVYHLCNMEERLRLRLKITLHGPDPVTSSVTSVWKAANWMEREVFDMYGIFFEGHPDLRRILTPPGWEGYPLRKDYPLKGIQSR